MEQRERGTMTYVHDDRSCIDFFQTRKSRFIDYGDESGRFTAFCSNGISDMALEVVPIGGSNLGNHASTANRKGDAIQFRCLVFVFALLHPLALSLYLDTPAQGRADIVNSAEVVGSKELASHCTSN